MMARHDDDFTHIGFSTEGWAAARWVFHISFALVEASTATGLDDFARDRSAHAQRRRMAFHGRPLISPL